MESKQNIWLRYAFKITYLCFGLIAYQVAYANNTSVNQAQLEPILLDISEALSEKDTPHSPESLTRCKQSNNTECLNTYGRAMAAKKSFLALPASVTFPVLMNILDSKCQAQHSGNEFLCDGVLMTLHWFTSVEQDQQLFTTVKALSKEAKGRIFYSHYPWHNNRPNPLLWINYLSDADINFSSHWDRLARIKDFTQRLEDLDPNELWPLE